MVQQLAKLKKYIMDVLNRCGQITSNIITAKGTAESSMDDIMKAEEAIKRYFWSFYSHSLFSSLFFIVAIGLAEKQTSHHKYFIKRS